MPRGSLLDCAGGNRISMAGSRTVNMTEGSPIRLLTTFAFPLLIGNLFQQAYNLADSMIVGQYLGANALGAVGATGSISFLFFSLCNGISSGGGIVTSQFFGAGDDLRVRKAIINSAYLMAVSSLLMSMISFLLTPTALGLMGTPADILPDAVTYMRMTCISVPLIGVYNYASSMLRALGDSRTPLIFLIVACFLNVIMDILCVRYLGLGVFGAALATMIAQLIAGVGCLVYALRHNPYFRVERKYMRPDKAILLRAARLGLPLALQWSLIAVSTTALQTFVNSFGTTAVASFTATNRIEQLVQQPFGSLGMAMSTFAGQNLGAGKNERIRQGLRVCIRMVLVFALIMLAVMQTFGEDIMRFFVSEPEVIAMGGHALKLTSLFYFFLGMIYIPRSTLNGVGDALFSFMNGIVEVTGRIVFPFLLVMIPGVGVWSIWWTAGLTWVIASAVCIARYRYWCRKHMPPAAPKARGLRRLAHSAV